jgi:uncharacterized membrane protein YeaQ/YmgE (transglycosylase-associated protein family)
MPVAVSEYIRGASTTRHVTVPPHSAVTPTHVFTGHSLWKQLASLIVLASTTRVFGGEPVDRPVLHGHLQHTGHLTEGHTMSFIWAIIAGLIIGLIARAVLPGRQNIPIWLTILLGVIGAIIGNLIASALGVEDTKGIDWIRHIIQIAAAAGLIAVVAPLWAKRVRR